jgi:hypothetical protein
MEKKVIYAFPTAKDATSFQQMPDPQVIAFSVPVTHFIPDVCDGYGGQYGVY